MRRLVAGLLVAASVAGGCAEGGGSTSPEASITAVPTTARTPEAERPGAAHERRTPPPLAGATIVLDPGHQLGNQYFADQVNRQVPAGGFSKACNTTGTATDRGYPEATFTWAVSQLVRRGLERLGATVLVTRSSNSAKRWGPCVDERGRAGNPAGRRSGADLELSIHGDGSLVAGAHGFHVIAPSDRRPWTHDIYRPSRRLALVLREALHRGAGLDYATYIAGGDGLDVREDLATLNLSDVPTVLVELGNMRDAGDAARMTSARGRHVYARALVRGARQFVQVSRR